VIGGVGVTHLRNDAQTLVARRLANVDLKGLETLVARSVADTKRRYPKAKAL